jgi:hypothetical protein
MTDKNKITLAQEQCYRFIEWHLLWRKKFKPKFIMDAFGVSRYQASCALQQYKELCPKNVAPMMKISTSAGKSTASSRPKTS